MTDKYSAGDFVSIKGQPNSKVEITGPRNIHGKYPTVTSFNTKKEYHSGDLVPYGDSVGRDTSMTAKEARPIINPKPGVHPFWR